MRHQDENRDATGFDRERQHNREGDPYGRRQRHETENRMSGRRMSSRAEREMQRGTTFDRSGRAGRGNYDQSHDREQDFRTYDDWGTRVHQDLGPGHLYDFEDEGYDMDTPSTWVYEEWWMVPGPFVGVSPRGYNRSDDRVFEDVCERLSRHGRIDASDVQVEVKDGQVFLRGQVEDRQTKRMIEETAESIYGVHDIHNELRVSSQGERGRMGKREKSKNLNSLEDLYFEELKDLYDAEQQLAEALPKMADKAHSQDLKRGFREHLDQTHRQIERLTQIFERHGRRPERMHCEGMEGIIKEGHSLMKQQNVKHDVLDAALIAAAQKAEHYEIASYGTVRTYAQQLGYQDDARALEQTLNEESKTNERLTSMAVDHINMEAKR